MTDEETKLKQLDQQIEDVEGTLKALESQRTALLVVIVGKKWGAVVGSVVMSNGKECRVIGVERLWDTNKPWLTVNFKKKDGSWGSAERTAYQWEPIA